jgi:hypothetical protein
VAIRTRFVQQLLLKIDQNEICRRLVEAVGFGEPDGRSIVPAADRFHVGKESLSTRSKSQSRA